MWREKKNPEYSENNYHLVCGEGDYPSWFLSVYGVSVANVNFFPLWKADRTVTISGLYKVCNPSNWWKWNSSSVIKQLLNRNSYKKCWDVYLLQNTEEIKAIWGLSLPAYGRLMSVRDTTMQTIPNTSYFLVLKKGNFTFGRTKFKTKKGN